MVTVHIDQFTHRTEPYRGEKHDVVVGEHLLNVFRVGFRHEPGVLKVLPPGFADPLPLSFRTPCTAI